MRRPVRGRWRLQSCRSVKKKGENKGQSVFAAMHARRWWTVWRDIGTRIVIVQVVVELLFNDPFVLVVLLFLFFLFSMVGVERRRDARVGVVDGVGWF